MFRRDNLARTERVYNKVIAPHVLSSEDYGQMIDPRLSDPSWALPVGIFPIGIPFGPRFNTTLTDDGVPYDVRAEQRILMAYNQTSDTLAVITYYPGAMAEKFAKSLDLPAIQGVIQTRPNENFCLVFEGSVTNTEDLVVRRDPRGQADNPYPIAVTGGAHPAYPGYNFMAANDAIARRRVSILRGNKDAHALEMGVLGTPFTDRKFKVPDHAWKPQHDVVIGDTLLSTSSLIFNGTFSLYQLTSEDTDAVKRENLQDVRNFNDPMFSMVTKDNAMTAQASDDDVWKAQLTTSLQSMQESMSSVADSLKGAKPLTLPVIKTYMASGLLSPEQPYDVTITVPPISLREDDWQVLIFTGGGFSTLEVNIPDDEVSEWDIDRTYLVVSVAIQCSPGNSIQMISGPVEFVRINDDESSFSHGFTVLLPLREVLTRSLTWAFSTTPIPYAAVSLSQVVQLVKSAPASIS